jgi:hypothetical protein
MVVTMLIGYAPPFPSVHTLRVEEIPDELIDDETKSNSASTMFSSEAVKIWFRNLINATELQFNHPDESDDDRNAPRTFDAYIPNFQRDGFKVWNVQHGAGANTRLVLVSDGRYVTISGRPDYLICDGDSVLGNYLQRTRGIVEVQSNPDDERCELQLMVCMFVFMNRYGLDQVVGFLVYADSQVRAYKASRTPISVMYEENDRFDVQHIDDIFRQLNADNNN